MKLIINLFFSFVIFFLFFSCLSDSSEKKKENYGDADFNIVKHFKVEYKNAEGNQERVLLSEFKGKKKTSFFINANHNSPIKFTPKIAGKLVNAKYQYDYQEEQSFEVTPSSHAIKTEIKRDFYNNEEGTKHEIHLTIVRGLEKPVIKNHNLKINMADYADDSKISEREIAVHYKRYYHLEKFWQDGFSGKNISHAVIENISDKGNVNHVSYFVHGGLIPIDKEADYYYHGGAMATDIITLFPNLKLEVSLQLPNGVIIMRQRGIRAVSVPRSSSLSWYTEFGDATLFEDLRSFIIPCVQEGLVYVNSMGNTSGFNPTSITAYNGTCFTPLLNYYQREIKGSKGIFVAAQAVIVKGGYHYEYPHIDKGIFDKEYYFVKKGSNSRSKAENLNEINFETLRQHAMAAKYWTLCMVEDGKGATSSAASVLGATFSVMLNKFPNYTPKEMFQVLAATSVDLGDAGVDEIYGHGLVDLSKAIEACQKNQKFPDVKITPEKTYDSLKEYLDSL